MMYQEYEQVFGVIKELDIYSKYEDEMLKYLEGNVDLKREIVAVKQAVQTNFSFRENLPFTISKLLFDLMTKGRKLLNKLKF